MLTDTVEQIAAKLRVNASTCGIADEIGVAVLIQAIGSALEIVLTWDLPDEVLPEAIQAQARLIAHLDDDQLREEVAS